MKTNLITIIKDLVLFFGGLAGIAYQQITNNVNPILLIVFTAMAGVPGITNIITLVRTLPTALPSQEHHSASSQSESSTSLPSSHDDKQPTT